MHPKGRRLQVVRAVGDRGDAHVRNPLENPLIGLGYEGRDAAELIEQLQSSGVNALVDVG